MKVALYCRLSEEDKDKSSPAQDSTSIQNQKTMLIQYATAQNWEIYHIYSDDDYTGADRNRPQFKKLLSDAQEKKFQIVLCKTQSRFTRELELVEKYIHDLFPALGIRFISIVDNADSQNKGNKKSRQINGLINQWYLEDMSDNIRSVLSSRRQEGFHIGSFALYGYKKDPNNRGQLLIDPPAATVVQEVFTLFSQGKGKTAIAKYLNQKSTPNPSHYKHLQGLRYQAPTSQHSTLWKYYTISTMLQNEMYLGHMIQGKYGSISYKTKENKPKPKESWFRVENTHEPIISKELWQTTQTLLQQKSKPLLTGEIGLFSGKTKCKYCGYTLRSTKNRGKHYLKCPTRHFDKTACQGAFIPVKELEENILTELNLLISTHIDPSTFLDEIPFQPYLQTQVQQKTQEIETLHRTLDQNKHYLKTLYKDKLKNIIQEQEYLLLQAEFLAEKEQTETQLQRCNQSLTHLQKQTPTEKPTPDNIFPLQTLTRPMVSQLIDHIIIGKREKTPPYIPMEIHWNF